MVSIEIPMLFVSLFCAALAILMLFSRDALTCAISLLGILLGTAAIYGMIGAHFIATIQLVVYAGAIMILFIFSIMLLNLKKLHDHVQLKLRTFAGFAAGALLVVVGAIALLQWVPYRFDRWDNETMVQAGGNTKVLAHSLFTQHAIAFEAVSLALIIALVGAVTLAKRKIN